MAQATLADAGVGAVVDRPRDDSPTVVRERAAQVSISGHSHDLRRRGGRRPRRDQRRPGRRGLSDHQLDDDGRRLQRRRHERPDAISGAIRSSSSSRRASTRPPPFCEGFAVAGGRVTNFTSGQGLVLMKEVLYTICRQAAARRHEHRRPGAHQPVAERPRRPRRRDERRRLRLGNALRAATRRRRAISASSRRRAAEASQTPFFNVQDGFLTTHTVETVRLPELEFMKEFIGNPNEKLINLMDPANPIMSGVVQNQDSYMKGKIAQRWYYDRVEPALAEAFERVLPEDRPAVRLRRCPIAATTPSTSSSAWAATWRRPRRPSITCARRRASRPAA